MPTMLPAKDFKCVTNITKYFSIIYSHSVLWRTINLGRPVIALTSKCEAGIMFK
jgi:hypothetical protein